MAERRELRLVQQASPCDTNYFNRNLLTVEQALGRGKDYCPNYSECQKHPRNCALRYGAIVAKFVMQGGNLKNELLEFSQESHTTEQYLDSVDRKDFKLIQGKGKVIRAVEGFAKIVLLEDPFQSVFSLCEKCEGAKLEVTVTDSGRDGIGLLSGSGRTRRRNVVYCPGCDPVPRDGTFQEDIASDLV